MVPDASSCAFAPVYFPSAIAFIVGYQAIILSIHEGRGDHEIRGGPITGNGNIPHYCHAQEGLDVGIMRHGFERIPEKDEKIDLVSDDLSTDLLVPAQGSALEFHDFEAKFAFQDLAGGACRVHFVVCQEIAVVFGPFHQVQFLIVVSNQRNVLVMQHNNFLVSHITSLVLSPGIGRGGDGVSSYLVVRTSKRQSLSTCILSSTLESLCTVLSWSNAFSLTRNPPSSPSTSMPSISMNSTCLARSLTAVSLGLLSAAPGRGSILILCLPSSTGSMYK